MTRRKVSFLQGTVPAPYKLPAEDHRLNHAGLWIADPAVGPLGVRSGVVWGPGNPGQVSVVAGGVNVNPFQAVIQGSLSGAQGVYEVVADAVEFRAVTAASAAEFRRGYVVARVYDQLNAGTGAVKDDWDVEVVYGPNAATAGAAVLPPVPANALVLREFAVSNTGVITLVGATPYTGPRGTAIVCTSTTRPANPQLHQVINETDTKAWGIWNGTRWEMWDTVTQTYIPTATAGGAPIVVGNGTLAGRYRRMGLLCWVRIGLTLGNTTNLGTGALVFTLPFAGIVGEQAITAKTWTTGGNYLGVGLISGAATIAPYMPAAAGTTTALPMQNAAPGQASGTGVPAVPGRYTLEVNSNLVMDGDYETV